MYNMCMQVYRIQQSIQGGKLPWFSVLLATKVLNFLKNLILIKYVTRFGKTSIVNTSNFERLEMHKSHREWGTELKFSGMIKE